MYTIEDHKHRFAAWAAGRAASQKACRFTVEHGVQVLEGIGFRAIGERLEALPRPDAFDQAHTEWRKRAISLSSESGIPISHGIAAKLINVYLKSVLICAGMQNHEKIKAIHPPIDRDLLNNLARLNVAGLRSAWTRAKDIGWTNFNSEQYQEVIGNIRKAVGPGNGLWQIEEFWKGHR